jgi:hypothetical protein|tara:strand:- start:62 stop:469 length:408 start_codon:yes stop_codon:yes gene_type:complete
MDALVGLIMLIYCLGGLAYGWFYGFEQRLVAQIVVAGVGSVLILSGYIVAWIKNFKLPTFKLPTFKLTKKDSPKAEEDMKNLPFNCDEKSILDFKCLHYLKHRASETNSKEMMELVVKLNGLLFSGGCGNEKKED